MKEIALAVRVKNNDILAFLHAHIKSKLDFCKTIITTYSDNNFSYLLLAFDEEFILPIETILREIIIEYIESVYKIKYLKTRIKNPIQDGLVFNAYIKVLSVFDKTTDEDALNRIIMFNQTFFMDSFLDFRLIPLKKHWDNLANLSSDNLSMFKSSTFVDVIRFLLNTMDNNVYKVKVVCDNENFSIYYMKNRNARIKKIADCKDALDLITNVINNCPNYIDVYLKTNQDNEAVSFLSNIYANRLKIYSKNWIKLLTT